LFKTVNVCNNILATLTYPSSNTIGKGPEYGDGMESDITGQQITLGFIQVLE